MARTDPSGSRKLGLKLVLTGLVLATVVLTALFIHLLWSSAARRNVGDIVRQLNAEIVGTVSNEVLGVRRDAIAVQNALREAFFQGIIDPKDEAKREFIAQALLRSQSVLSWVSFGFPDGGFFGARKLSDQELNMVEVRWEEGAPNGQLRIDSYVLSRQGKVANFEFTSRSPPAASGYKATEQAWYQRAVAEGDSGWNEVMTFPTGERAAISTSVPVYFANVSAGNFRGVANVVIELEQLSRFLQGLRVGEKGTTVIIDRAGHIVASPDDRAIERQQNGEMPTLQDLGAGNRMLALVDHTLHTMQVSLPDLERTQQIEVVDPTDGESYYVTFAPLRFQGWSVATVIPQNVFLASIEESLSDLLTILAVLTLAMAGLAVLMANNLVARPLARITGQLKHIESFRLDRVAHLPSRLREFDGLSTALLQMSRGLASFQKYMPTELVRTLVSQGIEAKPGGSQENLTVMFADLAGFTSLSEALGEAVVPVLTEYLETASAAVLAHKGTIDKFIGDAVMAFWGAPIANPDHARDACAAALAIQRRMAAGQAALNEPRADRRVRIGINTGRMLVGNVGSADRLNYTVIGDPVNVASRLEAVNKRYGTSIIIGEETRRAAGDAVIVRQLDWIAVYGRMEGIAIYELLAMADEAGGDWLNWPMQYEAGLAAYGERRWEDAERHFVAADADREGGDPPSRLFIERCRRFMADPPGPDWTRVAVQAEK